MSAVSPQHARRGVPLFGKAIAVSLVFHLSAITLFSIVIYFPRQGVQYFRLSFVEEPPALSAAPAAEPAIVAALTGPRNAPATAGLDLPKLSFDPQEPLGIGKLSLGGKSFFAVEPESTPDSWARFGTGIQRVRASLLSLTGVDTTSEASITTLELGAGLRATADWGAATPRDLLYAPPTLLTAPGTASSAEFLITVDAVGAVISAIKVSPGQDAFGDNTALLLERCRFDASSRGAGISTATVRVSPAGSPGP